MQHEDSGVRYQDSTKPPSPGLGLSLSGGGFRATLFHLGVISCLRDRGCLGRVKIVTSVSGGSILAAHMACNWDRYIGSQEAFEQVAGELIAFTQSDLRGYVVRRWMLGTALLVPRLFRRMTFTSSMTRRLAKLYGNATIRKLAEQGSKPAFQILATSLTTGGLCKFTGDAFIVTNETKDEVTQSHSLSLSTAVAASAAFPPLFPPVPIDRRVLRADEKEYGMTHQLTDGGVFDNLGLLELSRVLNNRKPASVAKLIVSNAGGNFDWTAGRAYRFVVSRNVRATNILMNRVGDLVPSLLVAKGVDICHIDIGTPLIPDGDPLVQTPELQRSLRNIRTDLDRFSDEEVQALVKQGYCAASHALGGWEVGEDQRPVSWKILNRETNAKSVEFDRPRVRARLFAYHDLHSWLFVVLLFAWIGITAALCRNFLGQARRTVPNLPSIAELEQRPIIVTLLAPVSGNDDDRELGLRQLRGVIGGIIHTFTVEQEKSHVPAEDWNKYFTIRVVDTTPTSATSSARLTAIRNEFDKAQEDSTVVFGPAHSQEVVDALVERKVNLRTITILTSAGTTTVRNNWQYGSLIWQLSNSTAGYAGQYMRYVEHYLQPHPQKTFILYRETEYGRNSSSALITAALADRDHTSQRYPYPSISRGDMPTYVKAVEDGLQPEIKEINALGRAAMIIIADQGPTLDALAPEIRRLCPNASFGTMTTLTDTEIGTGSFDSAYLIYSYAPVIYSDTKATFLLSQERAETFIQDHATDLGIPSSTNLYSTVPSNSDDAEIHDATIYYLLNKVLPRYKEFSTGLTHSLFATDFVISGTGPDFGNVGDLFLFRVKGKELEPVSPTAQSEEMANTPPSSSNGLDATIAVSSAKSNPNPSH